MTLLPEFDTPLFESGFPRLDEEHRVQFELLDALAAAVVAGRAPAEIDLAVGRIVDFLRAHFLSEYLQMERYRYPERESHAREHDQAIELLVDLRRRHAARGARWSLESVGILRRWMAAHVRGTDRSLARFLGGAGPPTSGE